MKGTRRKQVVICMHFNYYQIYYFMASWLHQTIQVITTRNASYTATLNLILLIKTLSPSTMNLINSSESYKQQKGCKVKLCNLLYLVL